MQTLEEEEKKRKDTRQAQFATSRESERDAPSVTRLLIVDESGEKGGTTEIAFLRKRLEISKHFVSYYKPVLVFVCLMPWNACSMDEAVDKEPKARGIRRRRCRRPCCLLID